MRPWNGVVVRPVKTSLSLYTVLQSIPIDWRTAYVCDSRICATKLTRSWTSSRTPCVADLVRPRDSLVFIIHRAAYDCVSVTVGVCTSSLANTDLASSSIPWSTSSAPWLLHSYCVSNDGFGMFGNSWRFCGSHWTNIQCRNQDHTSVQAWYG